MFEKMKVFLVLEFNFFEQNTCSNLIFKTNFIRNLFYSFYYSVKIFILIFIIVKLLYLKFLNSQFQFSLNLIQTQFNFSIEKLKLNN